MKGTKASVREMSNFKCGIKNIAIMLEEELERIRTLILVEI